MSLRILVIDDDPDALKFIRTLIEANGYEVLTFTDSRQASQIIKKRKFDAVFLDALMPSIDGFQLTAIIRASSSNANVPIVMVTGMDDLTAMRRAFKAGVSFFLNKPFNPDKLRGLLLIMRNAILKERRRYARLPFSGLVKCKFGGQEFSLKSINLSECGMLLESCFGLDPGQEISLQFSLSPERAPVKAQARIIRKELPDRIGVFFLGLTPGDEETIRLYVVRGLGD